VLLLVHGSPIQLHISRPRHTCSESGLLVDFCDRSVGLSVCLSVCLLVTRMYCGKTAELIEIPFGMVSRVAARKRVLDGRAHWHHLANTVERLLTAAMSCGAVMMYVTWMQEDLNRMLYIVHQDSVNKEKITNKMSELNLHLEQADRQFHIDRLRKQVDHSSTRTYLCLCHIYTRLSQSVSQPTALSLSLSLCLCQHVHSCIADTR